MNNLLLQSLFKQKTSNICRFQLLNCEDLLPFPVFFFFFYTKTDKTLHRLIVKIIGKLTDNENNPRWQSNISELQDISDPK